MLPFSKHWLVDKKRNPTPPWSHLDSSYTHLLMSYNVPRKRVTSGLLRPKVWRPFRTKWRLLRHQMLPYAWLVQLDYIFVPISGFTCNMGPSVIAQKTPRLLRSPPMEQEPSALGRPRWGLGGGFWTSIKHCRGHAKEIFHNQVV